MKRLLALLIVAGISCAQEVNPDKRLEHATVAIRAFFSPDSPIPKELGGKAQCVVVVPRLMKGAFLIGEKYGRGFAACRRANGGWSAPAAIAIEGGNFGPQLGSTTTDLIILVMNEAGMKELLGGEFTLGGQAEASSYSRTKGLFSGISLEGATLRPDGGENKKLYGHETGNSEILVGKIQPPRGARAFVAVLNKHARKAK